MYYPYSENKGADQLCGYRETDLRLFFRLCKNLVFSRRGSYYPICLEAKTMMLYKKSPDRKDEKAFNIEEKYCHTIMSPVMKKPALCICKNKGADQLHGNRAPDQHLNVFAL